MNKDEKLKEMYGGNKDLEDVYSEIQDWRDTRTKQGRMPEHLWIAAAELTKRYPTSVVARFFHLDHNRLKKRASGDRPRDKVVKFVDMTDVGRTLSSPIDSSDYIHSVIVDVSDSRSRHLRLELQNASSSSVIELWRETLKSML